MTFEQYFDFGGTSEDVITRASELENTTAMQELDNYSLCRPFTTTDELIAALNAVKYFSCEESVPEEDRSASSTPSSSDYSSSDDKIIALNYEDDMHLFDSCCDFYKYNKHNMCCVRTYCDKSCADVRDRRRDQNKTASNRYRSKKRAEQMFVESLLNERQLTNDSLRRTLNALQTEFELVFALAKKTFCYNKRLRDILEMLIVRARNNDLLGSSSTL